MVDPATDRYAAAPAPSMLRRVQSFLNTRAAGRPPEPDLLATVASANRWLRTLDWAAAPSLRGADLPPLQDLRAALQAELEARRDLGQPPARDPDLARILESLRWRVTLEEGYLGLAADGHGWQRIAGTLVADILLAQQHDLWPRLRACGNAPCAVAFYDSSKNQSRVWHNTSDCGNLVNLRAARARQREQAS